MYSSQSHRTKDVEEKKNETVAPFEFNVNERAARSQSLRAWLNTVVVVVVQWVFVVVRGSHIKSSLPV